MARGKKKTVIDTAHPHTIIQTSGQWKDFKVLLENYEGREMVMEEGTFTMEPYGFMVLISK